MAPFRFDDGGRSYACRVDGAPGAPAWWWVEVSGDQSRYAPFRAAADDTEASVRARVLTYYDTLVARRTAPYQGWWQRRRGAKPATAAA